MKLNLSAPLAQSLKEKDGRRRKYQEVELAVTPSSTRRNDLTPALHLKSWAVASLRPPKRKLRVSSAGHTAEIAASVAELGYSVPVIVDETGLIIDGVARVEACRSQGVENIQCLEVRHLTAQQKRLLRLSVNRLQERGAWDLDDLRVEFQELIIEDAPIQIVGFSRAELDHILIDESVDVSSTTALAPEPDATPFTRLGDIVLLGRHRVICGDARDLNTWNRLMSGGVPRSEGAGQNSIAAISTSEIERASLVLTDEPYNVKIVGNVTKGKRHREFDMASGEMTDQEFEEFNRAWMRYAIDNLRDGGLFATFIDWRGLNVVTNAAGSLGLTQINLVVWSKTNGGMGSLYRSQHELLPLFKKGDAGHVNNVGLGAKAGRWRTNVWTYPGASSLGSDARKGLENHPTVKPVRMLADALLDLTNRDDLVLDPFLGSGSTLMAAEQTGRRCFGVELDPIYVDVIVGRWEKATGRSAERIRAETATAV